MMLEDIGKKIDSIFSKVLTPKERSLSEIEKVYHLSDFLPYKWYDDETGLFISEKQVGFVLDIMPLVGNSENMQKELSNIFTQILPEESSIQTILYADKNIGGILDEYIHTRDNSIPVMQTLARRRAQHLSQLAMKSHLYPYVLRNFRCYMSVCINLKSSVKLTIKKVKAIKSQIIATLNVVGVGCSVVNATHLLRFLDGIFNADFSNTKISDKRWNKFDPINDQVINFDTGIVVEDDLLRRGETEIKTFTVSRYPSEWTLFQMADLIGDLFRESRQFPCPFLMHYGVYIQKQSNDVPKIAAKAGLVKSQLRSPVGKYIPDIEREYAELDFAQNCLRKGERLVKTQFSVVLFSRQNEMSGAEQTLRTLFSSMLFKVESNSGTQLHSLLTVLPLSWNKDTIDVLRVKKAKNNDFNRVRQSCSYTRRMERNPDTCNAVWGKKRSAD